MVLFFSVVRHETVKTYVQKPTLFQVSVLEFFSDRYTGESRKDRCLMESHMKTRSLISKLELFFI